MKFPVVFKKHFLENFLLLGQDKVINVRLTMAKILGKVVVKGINNNELTNDERISQLIKKISEDS